MEKSQGKWRGAYQGFSLKLVHTRIFFKNLHQSVRIPLHAWHFAQIILFLTSYEGQDSNCHDQCGSMSRYSWIHGPCGYAHAFTFCLKPQQLSFYFLFAQMTRSNLEVWEPLYPNQSIYHWLGLILPSFIHRLLAFWFSMLLYSPLLIPWFSCLDHLEVSAKGQKLYFLSHPFTYRVSFVKVQLNLDLVKSMRPSLYGLLKIYFSSDLFRSKVAVSFYHSQWRLSQLQV